MTPHTHTRCAHLVAVLCPGHPLRGWRAAAAGTPATPQDTRTSVCPHVMQWQFSALRVNPLPAQKAATKLSVITHGQNCSSSTSSMTSLMSQGMQRVCFFPLPKSLSMMETGIYHRPCPWWEQGAHEAALHLLPLSWKRLVQVGLTPFSVRATRGKENRTERRGESGGECMEPNHFTSFCKLETRYG